MSAPTHEEVADLSRRLRLLPRYERCSFTPDLDTPPDGLKIVEPSPTGGRSSYTYSLDWRSPEAADAWLRARGV